MLNQAKRSEDQIINGLNVTTYQQTVEAVRSEPTLAKFQFRASNRWDGGGLNRTTIRDFTGAGEEQGRDGRSFTVLADEPPVLLGEDAAPNPVEYLLHALASCLTSSIVFKAAARGIRVDSIESTLAGDLDARAFLELSNAERKGYQHIRVAFKIRADATAEELKAFAEFSPVLDVLSHGTAVSLNVEKA